MYGAPLSSSLATIADQIVDYARPVAEAAQVPAIAIGLITRDGLVESRFLGSNHAGGPVTEHTVFEIGSATKAMLGATEAMLVERGDLRWGDRVIDHSPAFEMPDPWVTREFRVVDLLAQRAGLPEYAGELMFEFGHPWPSCVAALKYVAETSSFRSEFAYQNLPHYVAGEIVAAKLGLRSWGEAAQQLLFDPLGMRDTTYGGEVLALAADTTRGHTVRDGQLRERPLEDFPAVAEGAGSVVSNIADMSRWIALHLNGGLAPGGQLISREHLEETYRPRIAVTGTFADLMQHGTARPDIGYATGWFVHALPEGRVIEHGGNTEGYNSAVRFDPDRGVGVVILSNQGHNGGIATQLGRYAIDLIQGREPLDYYQQSLRQQEELAAASKAALRDTAGAAYALDHYVGVYEHPLIGQFELRVDGQDAATELVSGDTPGDPLSDASDSGGSEERLHASIGPSGVTGVAKRLAGSTFELRWHQAGNPELSEITAQLEFSGAGSSADRVTVKGFTFTRAN